MKPHAVGADPFSIGLATGSMLTAGVMAAGVRHISPTSFFLAPGLWKKNSPMSYNLKMTILGGILRFTGVISDLGLKEVVEIWNFRNI